MRRKEYMQSTQHLGVFIQQVKDNKETRLITGGWDINPGPPSSVFPFTHSNMDLLHYNNILHYIIKLFNQKTNKWNKHENK